MAERPIFLPLADGPRLVNEIAISFVWNAGMAPSQKKKNVVALHEAAAKAGFNPLLEISSKSEDEVGRRLSAFHLKMMIDGIEATLESCYQGSKVFERGGPFVDLYRASSRDAKLDSRLKDSGRLIGFQFRGELYPLTPKSAFYDWLYITALYPHREWLKRLHKLAGYTDIEFNPQRSVNCQARSFATFIALQKREYLEQAMQTFASFRDCIQKSSASVASLRDL